MAVHDRNSTLQKLADEAQAMKDVAYDSPKVDLWEKSARRFGPRRAESSGARRDLRV
jgi:hypothetical protein